jgi:hypothetical protein
MDNFKPRFLDNLHLALAVYRSAKVEVEVSGLLLRQSLPPVKIRAQSLI